MIVAIRLFQGPTGDIYTLLNTRNSTVAINPTTGTQRARAIRVCQECLEIKTNYRARIGLDVPSSTRINKHNS